MLFTNEGSGDGGLFMGIYVRYLTLLARECNLSSTARSRYNNVISSNALMLRSKGFNRSTLMASPNWTIPPTGNTDYSTELSAAMLLFLQRHQLPRPTGGPLRRYVLPGWYAGQGPA